MAQVNAVVLGAGIVGTSIALHLAKRGLAVALVDRRAPGEETSYGNAGIIEGNTVLPPAFPSELLALLRIALKRSPEANYHLSFLPQAAPWLLAFRCGLASAAAGGNRPHDAAIVLARGGGARSAAGGGRRRPLSAQEWLAQALSQRAQLCGAGRPACAGAGLRHCLSRARDRSRVRAGAEPRSGFSSRRAVGGRRQHHQSAGGHSRLCGAVCLARRRDDQRRCTLASPLRGPLAPRHRARALGCGGGGGGARAVRA